MGQGEVIIRLEFDEFDFKGRAEVLSKGGEDITLREAVYRHLIELLEDDSLAYEVEFN